MKRIVTSGMALRPIPAGMSEADKVASMTPAQRAQYMRLDTKFGLYDGTMRALEEVYRLRALLEFPRPAHPPRLTADPVADMAWEIIDHYREHGSRK